MPTLITEDFESYAVGSAALGAVWTIGSTPTSAEIQAGVGRSGSKGVFTDTGAIQKTLNPSGGIVPYFDVTAWSFRSTAITALLRRGLSIQIALPTFSAHFLGFYESDALGNNDPGDPDHYLTLRNSYDGSVTIIPAVYTDDVYQKFRLVGRLGTPLADGSDLSTNGCVSVYVNDVLIAALTSIKTAVSDTWDGSPGSPNVWLDAYFAWGGYLDDVTVLNDAVTCPLTPTTPPPGGGPLPNTPPCCHTECCGGGGGGGGGGPTPGTQPPGAPGPILPPVGSGWTPGCTGGGTVPTAADVVDAESWVM